MATAEAAAPIEPAVLVAEHTAVARRERAGGQQVQQQQLEQVQASEQGQGQEEPERE